MRVSRVFLLKTFNDAINDGTYFTVLQGKAEQLTEPAPVCVRVFPAGLRAKFINGTIVVGHQERAGCLVEDVVMVFIQVHVLLNDLRGFYFQGLGQSFDILVGHHRTYAAAAIGAREAIECFESFVV